MSCVFVARMIQGLFGVLKNFRCSLHECFCLDIPLVPSLNHQQNSQGYRLSCILKKVGNFGCTENESDSYGGKSPFCGNFQLVSCWWSGRFWMSCIVRFWDMTSGGVCSTYFNCFVEPSLSCEGYSIETEDIYVSNLPLGKLQSVFVWTFSQKWVNYSTTILLEHDVCNPGLLDTLTLLWVRQRF